MRQAALVSDESALEVCLRRCAIQIDDLFFSPFIDQSVCSVLVNVLQPIAPVFHNEMKPPPGFTSSGFVMMNQDSSPLSPGILQ